jgi:hypothetical protein
MVSAGRREYGSEFSDLLVNPGLLRFVAFDGSGDEFGGEFWVWHE